MAASYPNTIPSLVDPVGTDKTNSTTVPHAELHTQVNDEIEAIATELGTLPKGASASVKARFEAIETDVTAAQGDITALEAIDHTQNTDTKLDNGGANEVTAAQAKSAYTHTSSTTDHVPSQTGNSGKFLTTNGTAVSWKYVNRSVILKAVADDAALTTGDGKMYLTVPVELNGMNLTAIAAHVYTASTSGTPTIQVYNLTDTSDMLSTRITIDENETDSSTATAAAVIDTAHDDVATADVLRVDVDVAGTGTKGLELRMSFQIP